MEFKVATMLEIGKKRAFTLIEIVLVLVILGLSSALVIVNFDSVMGSFGSRSHPENVLKKAFYEAKYQASFLHEKVKLFYNKEDFAFDLKLDDSLLQSFPIAEKKPLSDDATIKMFFLDNDSMEKAPKFSNKKTDEIVFDPDGSSSQILVEIGRKKFFLDGFAFIPFSELAN